jgi:hypothetical protein
VPGNDISTATMVMAFDWLAERLSIQDRRRYFNPAARAPTLKAIRDRHLVSTSLGLAT